MKRVLPVLFFIGMGCCIMPANSSAQCVMCKKTASSLDDEGARGLNNGIIYLAFTPLALIGFIGYKWYQRNKHTI